MEVIATKNKLVDWLKISQEENDDYGSYSYIKEKKRVGGLVRAIKDQCEIIKIWKAKDEARDISISAIDEAKNSILLITMNNQNNRVELMIINKCL